MVTVALRIRSCLAFRRWYDCTLLPLAKFNPLTPHSFGFPETLSFSCCQALGQARMVCTVTMSIIARTDVVPDHRPGELFCIPFAKSAVTGQQTPVRQSFLFKVQANH